MGSRVVVQHDANLLSNEAIVALLGKLNFVGNVASSASATDGVDESRVTATFVSGKLSHHELFRPQPEDPPTRTPPELPPASPPAP